MLGGGGELVVQVAGELGAEAPELRTAAAAGRRRGAGGAQAVRRRAARARSSPAPIPTPSPSARSSSAAGCITSMRWWPARPSSGATGCICRRRPRPRWPPWRGAWAAGHGASSWRTSAATRPSRRRCSTLYRAELARAHAFVADETWSASRAIRSTWCRPRRSCVALVPFAAYEPPPIFLRQQTRPVLRDAARSVAPARGAGAAAPGPLPPRHSAPWWRTRPIPGITCSWSPRRASAPRSGATSGPR